jgi:hypothetical protein
MVDSFTKVFRQANDLSAKRIALISALFGALSFFATLIYSRLGLTFLTLKESDFLSAFPTYRMSKIFGKEDSMFSGSLAQKWLGENDWNYGPLHQLITLPLYLFNSVDQATTFLFFFLLLMFGLTIHYLINIDAQQSFKQIKLIPLYFIVLVNYPFLSALQQRNLEIVEVFLIVVALIAYRRERYFLAGALIGISAGIKFFPAIIVLQFIFSRNWQAIKGFVYFFIPQLLLAQFALGWQNSFTLRLLIQGESETVPLRQGLNDLILRFSNGANDFVLKHLYLILAATIFISVSYLVNKNTHLNSSSKTATNNWAFLLALICIIAPHSNNYYFVLLAPLIVQIYLYLLENRSRLIALSYGLALILLSAPLPFAVLWRVLPEGPSANFKEMLLEFQSYSPMFFGSSILLIIGVRLSVKSRSNQMQSG